MAKPRKAPNQPTVIAQASDLVNLGRNVLPASVVYQIGGTLVPSLPADPDLPPPRVVRCKGANGQHWLVNGLTPRADAMARLVARGVGPSAAYRAAYSVTDTPPGRVAQQANRIASTARFAQRTNEYRRAMEESERQSRIGIRDFVLGRLTLEAQSAPEAAARIKALDLLGKTEGMFTSVHRTEKSINPKDLANLKDQLEQRLRLALLKYNPSLSLASGPATGPPEAVAIGPAGPHTPIAPLEANGDPSEAAILIPSSNSPISPAPVSSGSHREMTWEDL